MYVLPVYLSLAAILTAVTAHRISDKKYWYKDSYQRKASDELLDTRFTHIFENKQIVCVEYSDLSEEDEREIFRVCECHLL